MAAHWILCPNYDVTPMLGLTSDSSCRDAIWQTGVRFGQGDYDLSNLCFESEEPHAVPFPDFGMDALGCPVFSDRLRRLLTERGVDNVDFYEASIMEYGNSARKRGYYAGNIVGLVACMDRERSQFDVTAGVVTFLESLAINEEYAVPHRVFRLQESPPVILIDADFKLAFDQAGTTGLQLIPPENWDGAFGFR